MYKIFINNKQLIIFRNTGDFRPEAGQSFLYDPSQDELENAVENLSTDPQQQFLFLGGKDIEKIFKRLVSHYLFIEAAGGLVKDKQDRYLFIFRRGCWDLPKGKVEKGESVVSAAVREVQEETGLRKISIISALSPTFHTYYEADIPVLKKTFWFEMKCEEVIKLKPQINEDITMAKWFDRKKTDKIVLDYTYPSVRDLLNEYFNK
jgi:8-oxo-dGTP pyrophosphatase MutT (NUDIX family)